MECTEDYESLYYACGHLRLALAYRNAGRLEAFLSASGDFVDGSGDMLFASWYELLDAIVDFFRIGGSGEYCTTDLYFSDGCIRDYFRIARRHAAARGIPLTRDSCYRQARDCFYNTMLDYCPYACWFRLVTQSHHEYGSGLAIRLYEDFDSYDGLLCGLLDVLGWFRAQTAALHASTQADGGRGLPTPSESPVKEAA